ncbi:MAG: hypothetical protein ACFHU9_01730 [Fluviicola sp.]
MDALFTESEAITRTATILQHIQTDYFSLILRELEPGILRVEWEEALENYHIQKHEIDCAKKAIKNYTLKNGPVLLLIKTFDGIMVDPEVQKVLQNKEVFDGINAVAIELQSTTNRISLNLSAQFSRNRIPIRAFTSESNALQWLKKKFV